MAQPQTDGEGVFIIDAAMKAAQWEIAKGHLRALVAIQGSYSLGRGPGDDASAKWQRLEAQVDVFVRTIEDAGLAE